VFRAGHYAPGSESGRHLLAHELTHVLQQGASGPALQRKKLTEEDKKADLQSDRLKGDARLQQAYDDSPLLAQGEISDGVKTLQRALKDLHYELPLSFKKTGDADADFGRETRDVVRQFQIDEHLEDHSGIVGRETLDALDKKFLGPHQSCGIHYRG